MERKYEKSKPTSSVRSRSSTSSKFSRQSVISKRIEAATLQIEMDFLEQETEFRKLQTNKEIALENAEEAATSKFLKEQTFQPSRFLLGSPDLS